MVPLPRVPRWVPYVAAAVWLCLVVLAAAVEDDKSFGGRLIALVLSTVAPVAFAAAGGTLVVERWQHRQWERRTRFIVATLLDDSLDVLGSLAVKTYDILPQALPERQRPRVPSLSTAFKIPLRETQIDSMRAAIVIVKGMISALTVEHREVTQQAQVARRVHEELRSQYMKTWLEEAYKVLGRDTGIPERDREVREDTLRPAADDGTAAVQAEDEELEHNYEAFNTSEFPEGAMPFKIEPGDVLKQELCRQYAAISAECDATTAKLCELILDLSAYVPVQSLPLVETLLKIRQTVSSRPKATAQDVEVPSRSPSLPDQLSSSAESASAVAEVAEKKARKLLTEAENVESEALQALSIALWVLRLLREIFKLLVTLDEVYRLRYRDLSHGVDRLPILIREAGNAKQDSLETFIASMQAATADAASLYDPDVKRDKETS